MITFDTQWRPGTTYVYRGDDFQGWFRPQSHRPDHHDYFSRTTGLHVGVEATDADMRELFIHYYRGSR